MTKKKIEIEIGKLDVESTALSIIDRLQDFVDDYGNDVFVEKEYSSYSGGDDSYYAVKANVLETDEQEELREKAEALLVKMNESRALEQYKILQKKFGDSEKDK